MSETIVCTFCEDDCSGRYYICEMEDWALCPHCFDRTACAEGAHGQDCWMIVMPERELKQSSKDKAASQAERHHHRRAA